MKKGKKLESPMSDRLAHNPKPPRSSTSQDARALRSADALRAALLSLLEREPFDQITVRDICAEAGVHYATFFRHHPTKESLLDDIAAEEIQQLNRLTLAIRGGSDYQAGFRALCAYVDEHRSFWSTLLNGGAGPAMRQEWVHQAKAVESAERPVTSWLPSELATVCAASLIAETLAWWVAQPPGKYSVDTVAGILMRQVSSLMEPE